MRKCKYTRASELEAWRPSCFYESDPAFDGYVYTADVHPDDCEDWTFCPYCGGKIKFKEAHHA